MTLDVFGKVLKSDDDKILWQYYFFLLDTYLHGFMAISHKKILNGLWRGLIYYFGLFPG